MPNDKEMQLGKRPNFLLGSRNLSKNPRSPMISLNLKTPKNRKNARAPHELTLIMKW